MKEKTVSENITHNDSPRIDWFILICGSILLLTIVITIVTNQEWSETVIQNAFNFITKYLFFEKLEPKTF